MTKFKVVQPEEPFRAASNEIPSAMDSNGGHYRRQSSLAPPSADASRKFSLATLTL